MTIKRVENRQEQKVPVKIWTDDVDHATVNQLCNVAQLPFIHSHVAAMPDVHLGKGATVGSVIPQKGAIIPAAVGVDIGCGMNAIRLDLHADQLPDNLLQIRLDIEASVPLGAGGAHQNPLCKVKGPLELDLHKRYEMITEKHTDIIKMMKNPNQWARQLGTLGSGNHFIEICIDESNRVWIMLHSGSRGIGNRIGSYFIGLAKKDMERHFIQLPDKDLAYLPEGTEHFNDYWFAVQWGQDYARYNRELMMTQVLNVMKKHFNDVEVTDEAINCHHNYVELENHFGQNVYITRKGAIRARRGDLGIIPGSMGAKSFIVEGLGNADSFHSCSHGAGRVLSRSAAKRQFTREDLIEQTKGIECRKDNDVIDEIPASYKDIDVVMSNQSDLVKIRHTLKQVVNCKG